MTHAEVIFFEGQRYDRMTPALQARITARHKEMLTPRPDGSRRPLYELSAFAAVGHTQRVISGYTQKYHARSFRVGASGAEGDAAIKAIDMATSVLAAAVENTPAGRAIARRGRAPRPPLRSRPAGRTRPAARRPNWPPPGVTGLSEHGAQVVARATAFVLGSMSPDQVRMLADAGPDAQAAFAAKVADFVDGVFYYYVTGARS